jgi:predicted NBD/HSP70 family sugar kinase
MIQIGVDFGGTKIEAAALNPEGAFLARIRSPNPGSYDAALRKVHVDPDTIVFGGGLSNVSELSTALPATIGSYVFSDTWATKLVAARWGDSSGVRGAARLWPIR